MYTFIVFLAGIVVGTIFNVVITKWYRKAKAAGTELANDIKKEVDKNKKP